MSALRLTLLTLLSAAWLFGCGNDIAGIPLSDSGSHVNDDGGAFDGGDDGGPNVDSDGGVDGGGGSDGGVDGGPLPGCQSVCFTPVALVDAGDGGQFLDFQGCNRGGGLDGQCPVGFTCTNRAVFSGGSPVARLRVCEPTATPAPSSVTVDLPPTTPEPLKVEVEFQFGPGAAALSIEVYVASYRVGGGVTVKVPAGSTTARVSLAPGRYSVSATITGPGGLPHNMYGDLTVVAPGTVSLVPRVSSAGTLVSFSLSLDGAAISALQPGEGVSLRVPGVDRTLSFPTTGAATVTALLESGTHEIEVSTYGGRFFKGTTTQTIVVQGQSATIPIALKTVQLTGTLKFDGVSQGRSGQVYVFNREKYVTVDFPYQDGVFQARVYPGTYDLLLRHPVRQNRVVNRTIGEWPILENVVVPAAGKSVSVDLTSRTFTVEVLLNGQPIPNSTVDRGVVLFGGNPILFNKTGPVKVQLTSFAEKHDVIASSQMGGVLPGNQQFSDFFYGTLSPQMGEAIVIDLQTAQATLEVQWNGMAPPDATARRGAFRMSQVGSPISNSFAFEGSLTGPLTATALVYAGNWQTHFQPRTSPDIYPGLPLDVDMGVITLGAQPVTKVVSQSGTDVTLRLTSGGTPLQTDRGTPASTVPVVRLGPSEFVFRAYQDIPLRFYLQCSVGNDPFCGGASARWMLGPIRF